MYELAKKLMEFELIVYDEYLVSSYLYPETYPTQAYLTLIGFVTNYKGNIIGRARLRDLCKIRRVLNSGDNFCTISKTKEKYKLEIWKHSFGVK
jgi:hypothetical protein